MKLEKFLEKYCPNNESLRRTFINYNINKDDFSYFFIILKRYKNIMKNMLIILFKIVI